VALALGAVACAGATDDATNIRATQARLNAHGYSNDGPTTWWWEYDTVQSDLGTANDTEVCGSGTGPKEPDNRCGPATGGSQNNTIPLNVVVTGLTADTTYHFRACGQDTNDPSPTCANVLSFKTTKGDSTASVSAGILTFSAAAGTIQRLAISAFTDTDGVAKYKIEDTVDQNEFHGYGSSIVPGSGCQSFSRRTFDDAVKCPASGMTRVVANTNDANDNASVFDSITIPTTLDGGAGDDQMIGGENSNDTLIPGPGGFVAFGGNVNGGGNDTINAQNGVRDIVWCGNGDDVANVDAVDDSFEELVGGSPYESCEVVNVAP
jgi:hypothetical protein